MTHAPPIPAGNQSPYPLQELPHKAAAVAAAPAPGDPRIAKTPEPATGSRPTLLAIAAGIGLAAIGGGLFYALGGKKPKPKKRKAAKRTPKQAG